MRANKAPSDPRMFIYIAPKIYRAMEAAGFDMRFYREVKPVPLSPSSGASSAEPLTQTE